MSDLTFRTVARFDIVREIDSSSPYGAGGLSPQDAVLLSSSSFGNRVMDGVHASSPDEESSILSQRSSTPAARS